MSTDKATPARNVSKTIGMLLTKVCQSKYCAALRNENSTQEQLHETIDWLTDCFTAHQHRKAISAKKRTVYRETLTGRPHDTSVQKATSDNENVDAV